MSESNESFEKDLEQLIRLFKKIKNKSDKDQFAHLDPAFAQNLDFIINNYEMVKNNIPKEMFNQMGLPFQQLMREFIKQMQEELGEEELSEEELYEPEEEQEEIPEQKKEENQPHAGKLEKIDARLKTTGLSSEEIDRLLDMRNQILQSEKE